MQCSFISLNVSVLPYATAVPLDVVEEASLIVVVYAYPTNANF